MACLREGRTQMIAIAQREAVSLPQVPPALLRPDNGALVD
jgi:hypothetical protein